MVIKNAMKKYELSERRACKIFDQYRTTQRYKKNESKFNEALRARVIELASEYGRYGYRRITALVNREGYHVNHKRVYRIWREEGLKVPQKQPKRGRLWLNDGSCIRHRPLYKNHVWSYDFVMCRTEDGRAFRVLNVVDEFTRECIGCLVQRRINSFDVLEFLAKEFLKRGQPAVESTVLCKFFPSLKKRQSFLKRNRVLLPMNFHPQTYYC